MIRSVVVVSLMLVGCQAAQPVRNTNRGELVVAVVGDDKAAALSLMHDVGSVRVGLTQTVTVRATNAGIDAMNVLGVSLGSVGNGSWFVRDTSGMLMPGASVEATVTFAPANVGAQSTQVTFSHDADAAFPVVQLSGTGT